MARLANEKTGAHSVAEHLCKQIDGALHRLERKRVSDEDVHEARKDLKKARASLRLLRPGLKDTRYRTLNTALRDAARPLSAARDSKVLLDTLRMLTERYGGPARALHLEGLKRVLNERRDHLARDVLGPKGTALAHSRRLLRESRTAIDRSRVAPDDWNTIGAGLKRVYAGGRRAMTDARKTQQPDAFHEWRKEVKYLRHQLEVLQPLWPGMIGELADQAHKLADYLGDEHDLSVLRETALAHRAAFRDDAAQSALLALIDRCQKELREKALLLGSRLYEEKPQAFASRFGKYWRDWRTEKTAA
jgi:CHAD domain-containing protein